jgi:hypothetical protein
MTFLCGWFVIAIRLLRTLGKVSASVHRLNRLIFVTWIHPLDKRDVIAESSYGISFSKIRKERITENLRKRRISSSDVQQADLRSVYEWDIGRKGMRLWGLGVQTGVVYMNESCMFSMHVETWDRRCAVWDAVHQLCYMHAERWNLFFYNINRLKPSGKSMYQLVNTKKWFFYIVYSIRFSEKTAVISLNSVKLSVIIKETISCR